MKLGEFRKLTENLSDDIDIVVCYRIEVDGRVDIPMMNVRLENKENIWCGDEYSDQVIYVDEPDYY